MPVFSVNASRLDPYKSYKFKVKWDGEYVAGVSKVSGFKRTTEVVKHRSGGDFSDVRTSPGQSDFQAITLERGVTHDPVFEQWAQKIWYQPDQVGDGESQLSLADFRKDITIEMYNESGQKVIAYTVYRCWASEFQALPELDASANVVAIQSLTLQCEGWERDTSVAEPTAPTFIEPES